MKKSKKTIKSKSKKMSVTSKVKYVDKNTFKKTTESVMSKRKDMLANLAKR